MFGGSDRAKATSLEQQVVGIKATGGKLEELRLDFALDLGGSTNEVGLSWAKLPGTFDINGFSGKQIFQPIDDAGAYTDYCSMKQMWLATNWGASGYKLNGSTGTVTGDIAGACLGILGAWIAVEGIIYCINTNESLRTVTTGLSAEANLYEHNGFLFFTALHPTACIPVVGYIIPNMFPDPTRVNVVEYFSIQNLGEGGQVGLYRGQLVVATARGVWSIKPGGSYGHWVLGEQLFSWHLTYTAQIGVTHDCIVALDAGSIYLLQEGNSRIYPGTRFDSLRQNGDTVVLGGAAEVAVSNNGGWECYGGYTAKGAGLFDGTDVYIPDRVERNATVNLTLETTTAKFPGRMGIREIYTHEEVTGLVLTTDFGTYTLVKSGTNPNMWRAGVTCKTAKLTFTVPSNKTITPPIVYFDQRSVL